jgi:hypothetical protein
MKSREPIAILNRREMGRFFRNMKGRVSFLYDEKWRNAAVASRVIWRRAFASPIPCGSLAPFERRTLCNRQGQ